MGLVIDGAEGKAEDRLSDLQHRDRPKAATSVSAALRIIERWELLVVRRRWSTCCGLGIWFYRQRHLLSQT